MTARFRGAVLAGCLLVAACSGDDGVTQTADGTDAPVTTAAVGGSVPPTQADGTAASTEPSSTAVTQTTPSTTASTTVETTTSTAAQPAPPPALGGVGTYAPYFLRAAESRSIALEVFVQSGAAPSAATIEHVRSALVAVSGKDVVVLNGAVDGGGRSWSADELRALADRGTAHSRDRAVLRIYFLLGDFEGDDGVLGIAVRSDMAAVFSDKVDSASGLLGNRAAIERAVALHEAGHLLGLVDLHLQTGREDPDHPGHSKNRDSVMFWAVESSLVGTVLGGGPPDSFDQADLDDLATIRNG